MSDIASWRWVLDDLNKRLSEAAEALQYEHNALRVVVSRLQKEIDEHSRDASKPGVLKPLSDSVEEAILQVTQVFVFFFSGLLPKSLLNFRLACSDVIIRICRY